MKKNTLIILLFLTNLSFCQNTFIEVDDTMFFSWEYPQDSSTKKYYDIDNDQLFDVQIQSWFNHPLESPVSAVILRVYRGDDNVLLFGCSLMSESMNSADGDNSGFIYNSRCFENYNGKNILPFKFESSDVFYNAFVHFEITDSIVVIDKFELIETLGFSEYKIKNQTFEYYTLQGKKITNPKGLVIKKYLSGRIEKVYICN